MRKRVACVGLVGLAVLAACPPMYGGAPDHLRTPSKIAHKDLPVPVEPIVYVDDCTFDFHRPAAGVKRDIKASNERVQAGDMAVASADTAPNPEQKAQLIRHGIDVYIDALKKDPYDAEATLKLALSYDKVLRKGCALALLKRLQDLAGNPRYADASTRAIDTVADHEQWFKGYRKAALSAIGRP